MSKVTERVPGKVHVVLNTTVLGYTLYDGGELKGWCAIPAQLRECIEIVARKRQKPQCPLYYGGRHEFRAVAGVAGLHCACGAKA